MPDCYVIVESETSLLLIHPGAGPERITRTDLERALRPMAALGYPVPDLDTLRLSEIAVRLSGLASVADGAGKALDDKLQEIAAFAAASGAGLRGCVTIPAPTYQLILRRGREADDRTPPPAA